MAARSGSNKPVLLLAAAAVVVLAVGGYLLLKHLTRPGVVTTAQAVVERLGLPNTGVGATSAQSDAAELAALQAGEAKKSIDAELEKTETLLSKYGPDSDEHRMLSRRVAMLKKLKENTRK